MLSKSNGFLFIHVPKTGGNSIQKMLLPFSDDQMTLIGAHQDGIDRFEIRSPELKIQKHSTLEEYRQQLEPQLFAQLTKICCVRNPWDRCVSYFFSPHRGEVEWTAENFAKFIRNKVQPHSHYLAIGSDKGDPFENVDVVLRYENLEADFTALCERLGFDEMALPRLNASVRDHYSSYYPQDDLIELVAEKFAPEIERFGYSF